MLSEEEKKAIEFIKFYQQHCLKKEKENMKQYETVNDEEFVSKNLDTVLNLITKLQKHLNFYEKNESYKERIIELKEEITKLQKENELAKEQLKKQCEIADERNNLLVKVQELQKENKEKDKIIDSIVKAMDKIQDPQVCKYCDNIKLNHGYCTDAGKCKECIKQYFEKLAKEDK